MPSSAVTGTKKSKDERTDSEREADENAAQARRDIAASNASPLADDSGNGTIQVTTPDGAIVSVDASQPGWKDRVRVLNPKHPVLKYENA